MDDCAIIDRWQYRMKTPKSEADETAPTFKDVLDIINPLQHIPIVGSIYRAITGDTPTPTARALGALIYGGPAGMLAAGVSAAVAEIAGGDPLEQTVAKLIGPEPEAPATVAAAPAATAQPAAAEAVADGAPAAASPVPLAAAKGPLIVTPPPEVAALPKPGPIVPAAEPARTAAAKPESPKPESVKPEAGKSESAQAAARKPDAAAAEGPIRLAAARVAPAEADPYAKFQPKRLTHPHGGNRIQANLAALTAAAMTAPASAPVAAPEKPGAEKPAADKPAGDKPVAEKAAAEKRAVQEPAPAGAIPAQALDFAASGPSAAAGAAQVPNWFPQAVLGALDRYREAGGLRPPTSTVKSLDQRR